MPTTNFNTKCVGKKVTADGDVRLDFATQPTGILKAITPTITLTVDKTVANLLILDDTYVWSITTP